MKAMLIRDIIKNHISFENGKYTIDIPQLNAISLELEQVLQQTPCTASLELIEQMLIEVESKMPVNSNPHVLGVIIQEIQALKWTMRLIKERQPMT